MTEPWYAAVYGQTYYDNYRNEYTEQETRQQVDGVLARLNLPPGARVLDLCCGFGRHSIELARRGFRVTGLDRSSYLLSRAREASVGLDIAWIEADMRAIPSPAVPYDAVICLFSSFGVLENDGEEARVARAVARVLAPGGVFLIETVNREVLLRRWQPLRWRERPGGALHADHMRFDVLTGTLHVREVIVGADGRRTEEKTSLRLWSCTELALLLGAEGFGEWAAFGDLDGSRYTWDSHHLVFTARLKRETPT